MNSTQAIVTLKNGKRKYGIILDENRNSYIRFIPSLRNFVSKQISEIIETIPLDEISSIDPFLK